jgi:formylglycine-generating enzyme required for sulfatase activity
MRHDVPTRARLLLVAPLVACAAAGLDAAGTVPIPAGEFTMGSTPHDRALALDDAAREGMDLRAGIDRLRDEQTVHRVELPAYAIMANPVTQAEYATYVYATGAAEPWVDARTWSRTPHRRGEDPQRVQWQHGRPREELMDRPAVLVSQPEAEGYCAWWGEQHGGVGVLPSEAQWERATRGDHGDDGRAPSPYGLQWTRDVAEWTSDVVDGEAVVKGADHAGDVFGQRAAARSLVAPVIRHPSIGFRCVIDVSAS